MIEPFHVMDVWKAATERGRTHGDVLTLAAGQPSTPAPKPVLRAARFALDTQVLGYTETFGILELREAIAEHHRVTTGVDVSADDVVVTTGSSGAFTLIFLAAFDAGDPVVLARPGYPAYRNTLAALGCRVIELDCGPETRFQPTVDMLDALREVPAGLILASPANPTGTDHRSRRTRRDRPLVRGARHAADLRRDLSRHRFRRRRDGVGVADVPRVGGDRFGLEVLLDDRVATGLDAGAGRSCAARCSGSRRT